MKGLREWHRLTLLGWRIRVQYFQHIDFPVNLLDRWQEKGEKQSYLAADHSTFDKEQDNNDCEGGGLITQRSHTWGWCCCKQQKKYWLLTVHWLCILYLHTSQTSWLTQNKLDRHWQRVLLIHPTGIKWEQILAKHTFITLCTGWWNLCKLTHQGKVHF